MSLEQSFSKGAQDAGAASPGNRWDTQILKTQTTPAESETLGVNPINLFLQDHPVILMCNKDEKHCSKIKTHSTVQAEEVLYCVKSKLLRNKAVRNKITTICSSLLWFFLNTWGRSPWLDGYQFRSLIMIESLTFTNYYSLWALFLRQLTLFGNENNYKEKHLPFWQNMQNDCMICYRIQH